MDNINILQYNSPVTEWIDGIPLGNGTTGAMLFGAPGREILALNHDRLWRNKYSKKIKTAHLIPVIRKLCLGGKTEIAEKILLDETKEGPDDVNSYQPFASLNIHIKGGGSYNSYSRKLDLGKGIASISYISEDVEYAYECFISEESNLLFLSISSGLPGQLSCSFEFSRIDDPECSIRTYSADGQLIFEGRFIEGVSFTAVADILTIGGEKYIKGKSIIACCAERVIVKMALSTSYNCPHLLNDCKKRINNINSNYENIREAHIRKYGQLFYRTQLELGSERMVVNTEELFDKIINSSVIDISVYVQLFNMARYLLMSASRPGTLPINLQGIWNDSINPAWDCSYTTDMNIQMHYWLSMPGNLLECHLPVFDWILENIEILKSLAGDIFGCSGVFIPQYTDFKFTPEKGIFGAFQLIWSGGAAWLAQHFYEYWKYTGEQEFLIQRAYPYMKECANFYKDFLVKDQNGYYISCPSCSPENRTKDGHWIINTSTMDLTLISELLGNLVSVSKILDMDEDERMVWEKTKNNLAPYPIDNQGCLREWLEDSEEIDPYHRHISHIYGIFPGKIFDNRKNPHLFNAAVKALYKRRAGGFGSAASWSHSWYACCFARIGDGDTALSCINDLIKGCMLSNYLTTVEDCRGLGLTDSYYNCRIFMADAILGAATAISEMLVQSFDDSIRILPALPSSWREGRVDGLRAYDGFELGIEWYEGVPKKIRVKSHIGGVCNLKICNSCKKINVVFDKYSEPDYCVTGNILKLYTEKNGVYNITLI